MIRITKSAYLADVYYAMCTDIMKMFVHRQTGKCYTELALGVDPGTHPDEIVKTLAQKIVDNYDITAETNLSC